MPKLRDARVNFGAGRTHEALQTMEQAEAYGASVFDAKNMMVTGDGKITRRWGTTIKKKLGAAFSRLETWNYARTPTAQFILCFGVGTCVIYDREMTLKASFSGENWDATTVKLMGVTFDKNEVVITDASFRTRVIAYEPASDSFSINDFEFRTLDTGGRLLAPFVPFADPDMKCFPTIFTSAGTPTAYGAHIATVSGYATSTFDLHEGTGEITTDRDYFVADHVGVRMRLGAGEFEVLTVVSATKATIKVWRDLAYTLVSDPCYFRDDSNMVELQLEDHGMAVDDKFFLVGVTDYTPTGGINARNMLSRAIGNAKYDGNVEIGSDAPNPYFVAKVVDENYFEFWKDGRTEADGLTYPGSGADRPNIDGLGGGADLKLFKFSGMKGLLEQAYSDARGWPQCSAVHEKRRWFGGSSGIPDAVFASRIGSKDDFDPAEGDPDDAIQMLGVGEQSRVRHLVPGFDMKIFCDNGEFYVPGTAETAITQETVRAIASTNYGAAFTRPVTFDGSVYFVDAVGAHIRDFRMTQSGEYEAPPATVVCPDWVKEPTDVCFFLGGGEYPIPYAIWANETDNSLIVMHSSKADGFFGFMRWQLTHGKILSMGGLSTSLLALVEFEGAAGTEYLLAEFDTTGAVTIDLAASDTADPATTTWTFSAELQDIYNGQALALEVGGAEYGSVTATGTGFSSEDALGAVTYGFPMEWEAELHVARAGDGAGTNMGQMQRLVDARINWGSANTGTVQGQPVLSAEENPALSTPATIEGWRHYLIGEWGEKPRLKIAGSGPGKVELRAAILNVYF